MEDFGDDGIDGVDDAEDDAGARAHAGQARRQAPEREGVWEQGGGRGEGGVQTARVAAARPPHTKTHTHPHARTHTNARTNPSASAPSAPVEGGDALGPHQGLHAVYRALVPAGGVWW